MRLSVRSSSVVIMAAAIVLAACGDDSSGPGTVPEERVAGEYVCTRATAFFSAGTQLPNGRGVYQFSPCRIYGNYTVPQRRDSIEVYDFTLLVDSTVQRLDYPIGTYVYDEDTGLLTISNPSHPVETYDVSATSTDVLLTRRLIFDFDGDMQSDTLDLTFLQQ